MVENIDNNASVLAMLDNQSSTPYKQNMIITDYSQPHAMKSEDTEGNETNKQNVIWTKDATLLLLNLYETKMHLLDNPKKKSKMWISMAEELKSLNIEVTPDQVRWKINALTKKYKDCIESGQGNMAFKYFNEMHQILGRYNDDNEIYKLASGVSHDCEKVKVKKNIIFSNSTPHRKLRAERRAKVELDKQWLEYLKRQEDQKQIRDQRYERSLRLKEEELALRKKELEMKESFALKKLQLREKKQEEILMIEREKCALLRKFLNDLKG
ncbi:reticulocyte-binding protein homolog 2a-like [Battus philenor]|uniref:reticulocyte-binding protein homolog 2a-like n=1 Tax=Battus philenor TaxID=42288 RepID=UPI0035D0A776